MIRNWFRRPHLFQDTRDQKKRIRGPLGWRRERALMGSCANWCGISASRCVSGLFPANRWWVLGLQDPHMKSQCAKNAYRNSRAPPDHGTALSVCGAFEQIWTHRSGSSEFEMKWRIVGVGGWELHYMEWRFAGDRGEWLLGWQFRRELSWSVDGTIRVVISHHIG